MSKDPNPAFHVLIPAAGSGTRAGLSTPKQYCKAGGKTILRHTIEKFLSIQGLKSLRVIIDAAHEDLYREAVNGLDLPPPVIGGATRKESVYNGLRALPSTYEFDTHASYPDDYYVLIHDAARPFVSTKAIYDLLETLKSHDAATLAAPAVDTLIDYRDDSVVDRKHIWSIQTPQGFHQMTIGVAHSQFENDNSFTDDASLVRAYGRNVELVPSSQENFKITTAEDLIMAEKLLAAARETRTGMGYDIHAFEPSPNGLIRLGGIDIKHDKKLKGHSDADVILHALTDALLGAIGEADIGQIFPPSDAAWKNADSAIFVQEAMRRVAAKAGTLLNADIAVIAEEPKIGPHREEMQSRIAALCGVTPSRIGIKATTAEGLGAIGRGEGIVAQAIVTVSLPAGDE